MHTCRHVQVWPHLLKLAALVFERLLFSHFTRPFFRFLSILVQNENVARHILREHCATSSDLAAISSLMVVKVGAGRVSADFQAELDAHEGMMNGVAGMLKIYADRFPNDCPGFEGQLLAPLGMREQEMFLAVVDSPMVAGALARHNEILRDNTTA